jgi:Tat protein translocase TatB subunit
MEFLGVGLPELLVILVLAVIVVGPQRLPEFAAQLGRFLRAFRRYSSRITAEFNETLQELEHEYDDMKGEWKDVRQGLQEDYKTVNEGLQDIDEDVRAAADEANAPAKPAQ